jgi:hypothetical protein
MPHFRTFMVYTLVILGSQSAVAINRPKNRKIYMARVDLAEIPLTWLGHLYGF